MIKADWLPLLIDNMYCFQDQLKAPARRCLMAISHMSADSMKLDTNQGGRSRADAFDRADRTRVDPGKRPLCPSFVSKFSPSLLVEISP